MILVFVFGGKGCSQDCSLSAFTSLYRRISQTTCQPKSVGKMADFENLNFSICPNSSQLCIFFCKALVTGYWLHVGKNSIPNCHPFSNWFCYRHFVTMGLTSREIRVYMI